MDDTWSLFVRLNHLQEACSKKVTMATYVQGLTGYMSPNFARAVELEPVKVQQHDWGLLRALSIPYKSYI